MAFRGRVALVTGAASGMGRMSAERLSAAGATVAAVDVNEAGLRDLADGTERVRAFPCDVSDDSAVRQLVKSVELELGPVDRVMNAAAIAPSGLLAEQGAETVQRLMRINFGGVVNVTYSVLPGMIERGSGDLVQFGSLAGWLPSPYMGAYSATKFAVNSFSEVLYHENQGRGVRIVCVCPPVVETPMLEQIAQGGAADMVHSTDAIQPGVVLDAIEESLEAGELWAFPGRGTKAAWRVRRFAPGLLWRRLHSVAGF